LFNFSILVSITWILLPISIEVFIRNLDWSIAGALYIFTSIIFVGAVSSCPSLQGIYVILISLISITLLKILDCFSRSIGGLLTKVAQSMGSTICVEKYILFPLMRL